MEKATMTPVPAQQSLEDAVRTAVEETLGKHGKDATGMVLHLIFEGSDAQGKVLNGVSVVLGEISPGRQRELFQNTMRAAENYDPAKERLRFN